MRTIYFLCICLLFIQFSCTTNPTNEVNSTAIDIDGFWIGSLHIYPNKTIPFNFKVSGDSVHFYNAEEKITTTLSHNSSGFFTVKMPVFNSQFSFQIVNQTLKGSWKNFAKSDDYEIKFSAVKAKDSNNRFIASNSPNKSFLNGNWEVSFAPDSEDEFKAIGIFNQHPEMLSGTFLTETGDYRYLQGISTKDSLFLSCFDGSHAFLFEAKIKDTVLEGMFYSGNHYSENWTALKNNSFSLSDPYSITTLDDTNPVSFSFPDTDSIWFSYPNEKFSDKVVIIQIIGSWCPNCLDETVFFTSLYNKYKNRGLEVVALTYEKSDSFKKKVDRIMSLKNHLSADYPFLIAGNSSKKEVEETLPFLVNVASFPTTIYIDKAGKIRRIYSGFYGPGTGKYHEIFSKETNLFVESLLDEKIIH